LHQILPAAITCVVGRKLCASRDEDHWALRALAARVVYTIARRYGERFADLQVRTTVESTGGIAEIWFCEPFPLWVFLRFSVRLRFTYGS